MPSAIITVPNTILRQQNSVVDLENDALLKTLSTQLKKTLDDKEDPKGVGISAPQIGKNLQAFATLLPENANTEDFEREDMPEDAEAVSLVVYWNPKILSTSPEKTFGPDPENPIVEGCLSIPKLYAPVPRFSWVELEYVDEQLTKQVKKFHGFAARVVQHEYDHLQGMLFTDYVLQYDIPLYELRKNKFVEIDSTIAQAF